MKFKALTVSVLANIGLVAWLAALYSDRTSGIVPIATQRANDVQAIQRKANRPEVDRVRQSTRPMLETRQAEVVPPKDPKQYRPPLVSKGGVLTTGAAQAAGINPDERVKVQALIDQTWDEFEVSTSQRATLNTKLSDPEKGISVYDIPASPDRGTGIRNIFSEGLKALLGMDRAQPLMDALANTDAFGGLGAYDVRLRFLPPDQERGTDLWTVEYVATDPDSGRRTESASMTLDVFKQTYGASFVLDGKPQ